jgi:hypothetical protein
MFDAVPNIMIDWLALLLHILEVMGSNLGLLTGYPSRGVPQSLQANSVIVP